MTGRIETTWHHGKDQVYGMWNYKLADRRQGYYMPYGRIITEAQLMISYLMNKIKLQGEPDHTNTLILNYHLKETVIERDYLKYLIGKNEIQ